MDNTDEQGAVNIIPTPATAPVDSSSSCSNHSLSSAPTPILTRGDTAIYHAPCGSLGLFVGGNGTAPEYQQHAHAHNADASIGADHIAAETTAAADDDINDASAPCITPPQQQMARPALRTIELRRREWCITHWIVRPDIQNFEAICKANSDIVRYAIWQEEICPTTKKHHLQMFMEFMTPVSRLTVYNIIMTRLPRDPERGKEGEPWITIRKYTKEQCRDYCKKNQTRAPGARPYEWGEMTRSGVRTDLNNVQESIRSGKTMRQITDDHFNTVLRYGTGVARARSIHLGGSGTEPRPLTVTLLEGLTGTGKTFAAFTTVREMQFNRANAGEEGWDEQEAPYILSVESSASGFGSKVWWDGYDANKCIIMDDYNDWLQIHTLLHLLDEYPCRLEIKGAFTYALYNYVFITSNIPLEQWKNPNGKEFTQRHVDALRRRIHNYYVLPSRGVVQTRWEQKPIPELTSFFAESTTQQAQINPAIDADDDVVIIE